MDYQPTYAFMRELKSIISWSKRKDWMSDEIDRFYHELYSCEYLHTLVPPI